MTNCLGFLRRLTVLRALDRLRRRRATAPLQESVHASAEPSPEKQMLHAEEAERVRQALARLPRQMAAIFCLRYFEDLSNLQIAEALDTSPSAVSTALHKARTRRETMLSELEKGS